MKTWYWNENEKKENENDIQWNEERRNEMKSKY